MSDEAFYGILLLFSAVSAGYVLSHLAVERLSRRRIVVADVQYVVLGVVLGPLLGLIDTERAHDLRPVLSLGGAALGMLAGLRLRETKGDWVPSVVIAVTTALTVIGLPLAVLSGLGYDILAGEAWTGAVIGAGVVALMTTESTVRAMTTFLGARGLGGPRAAGVATQTTALAIVGYGLLFALMPSGSELQMRSPLVALEAMGIEVASGVLLGLLFAASVYRKLDDRVLLAVLVGTIFLAAGIARTTHVSAIFVSFVAGVTFSATSRRAPEVTRMLGGIKRPFVMTLFFFAGLEWVSGPAWTFALVPAYLVLRWAGRRLGGLVGKRLSPHGYDYSAAVLPAGGLAVALMLGMRLSFPELPGLRDAYGALLVAVVLTDLGALRAIRRWIIDVDDVPPAGRERRGGFDLGATS
jgi:Kef-type K+ transport system membrane component KefB